MLENKRVLVSGCSFSTGKKSWPNQLQQKCGFQLVNLAQSAAGNLYIHNSIISELARRDYDFVIVMWSGLGRVDLQVQDISFFSDIECTSAKLYLKNDWPDKVIHPIDDREYIEKNWVFVNNYNDPKLQKMRICESNFKYQGFNEKATQSLMYMISLQNTLKQLGIRYVFSFYIDYDHRLKEHYLYKLLDTKYIFNEKNLGTIFLANNWVDEEKHPAAEAHQVWANYLDEFIKKTYA